jgi:uncharacterized protein (DUF1697 family)
MPRYAAFLRAINVGGRTVKMERLRALLEALELDDVRTVIASGNVVFASNARSGDVLEARIETHLRETLGYDVPTYVRSAAELSAIAAYAPFGAEHPSMQGGTLLVTFHKAPPSAEATRRLLGYATESDAFHVHGRESYWGGGARMSDSPFFKVGIEKAIGMPGTGRNMNTVRRIAAML